MFKCELCDYTTDSRLALGGHLSGHTRRGEKHKNSLARDFICQCGEEFKNGNALRGHLGRCGKPFEEWSGLARRQSVLFESKGRCSVCRRKSWMGKPIPLELDHIDGNADNNRRENLRIVCLNCHGQTDTYRRKNKNAAPSRKARYEKYYKAIGVMKQ